MLDYKLFQNPVKHLKWLKAVNAPILIGVFLGEGRGGGGEEGVAQNPIYSYVLFSLVYESTYRRLDFY